MEANLTQTSERGSLDSLRDALVSLVGCFLRLAKLGQHVDCGVFLLHSRGLCGSDLYAIAHCGRDGFGH